MSESGMDGSDALQAGQAQLAASSQQGPGARLAAQRQALGWSIEHVANQLNLAPRQVQALEIDDYAALPGLVIARGFVRAYAKLLKIDAAPLVASMAQESASPAEAGQMRRALPASFTDSGLKTSSHGSRSGMVLALAIAALVGIGWLAYQNKWFANLPEVFQAQNESSRSSQPAAAPQAEPDTAGQADDDAAAGVQEQLPDAQGAESAAGMVSTPEPTAGEDAAAPQASATADEKSINPAHNLILKVREESWVEIKRTDGTTIAARLLPAGATESFALRQPALLVIGNAAGVDAIFRGKPLDLTTAAKSNVARLNLQ